MKTVFFCPSTSTSTSGGLYKALRRGEALCISAARGTFIEGGGENSTPESPQSNAAIRIYVVLVLRKGVPRWVPFMKQK